jgi:hypothetical protein
VDGFRALDAGRSQSKVIEEANTVAVVGDHQPVERARKTRRLAAGGYYLLAAGEAVGLVVSEATAEQARIRR